MDIHKPKAAHSWREFAIEIGTIICGILIALGLEQAVEAAHRDTEVREAREALHAEIKTNAETLAFGLEELKCLEPQVDAYGAWARGGAKPPALRTVLGLYATSTWETVKIGAVPHMPLKERLAVAAFYDDLRNADLVVREQRSAALALFGAYERSRLTPELRERVLDAVAVEHRIGGFKDGNSRDLLVQAAALGVQPRPLTAAARARIDWLCGKRPEAP